MAFMADLMVDDYGYLYDGEETFPVNTIDHDWRTPYPTYDGIAEFAWEPGELGVQPNVFRHPEIRDWVCDEPAWSVLSGLAPGDLRLLGRGELGGKPLFVVQVVTILDIVDRSASIFERFPSYEVLRFPTFVADAEKDVGTRVFRVPGAYTDLFLGRVVKEALDAAKIAGLRYAPVDFSSGDRPR